MGFIQTGFINGLCFANSASFMIAAVGQEHRLGRWWRNNEARNRLVVIKLNQ